MPTKDSKVFTLFEDHQDGLTVRVNHQPHRSKSKDGGYYEGVIELDDVVGIYHEHISPNYHETVERIYDVVDYCRNNL